jgi:hypothetical protein
MSTDPLAHRRVGAAGSGGRTVTDSLRDAVARIPGAGGWWYNRNQDVFDDLAGRLRGHGLDDDEIVAILTAAYGATADEFGSQ